MLHVCCRILHSCAVALCFVSFCLSAQAQDATVDSLKQERIGAPDTVQVRLLYTLTVQVEQTDEAIAYGREAVALADSLQDDRLMALARLRLASRYLQAGRNYRGTLELLDEARGYFYRHGMHGYIGQTEWRRATLLRRAGVQEEAWAANAAARAAYQAMGDWPNVVRAYNQLGWMRYLQSHYPESVAAYTTGLRIADSLGTPALQANLLMGLIRVATRQSRLGEAWQYVQRLEALPLEGTSDYSRALNTLANVYEEYRQYEKALAFYEASLEAAEKQGLKTAQEVAWQNIGLINRYLKHYTTSEAAYQEALRIKQLPGPHIDYEPLWRDMGLLYEEMGQLENAWTYFQKAYEGFVQLNRTRGIASGLIYRGRVRFKQGGYDDAIRLAQEGIQLAQSLRTNDLLRDGYETLHRSYAALGRFEQAYASQERFHAYSDSVFNAAQFQDMGRLEAEYAFEQAQAAQAAEQERVAQQRQRRDTMLGAVYLVFLILLGGGALYAWQLGDKNKEIETQRAQLELQALRLKELDELKSRFFANISHELRTPLTLIQGHLEDVQQERYGEVPEEAQQYLDLSLEQTRRLYLLVQQLLDLARLQGSQLKLRATPVNLQTFVKRHVAVFGSLAAKHDITLRFTGPDETIEAYVDEPKLENILVNLIGNALKFTEPGGHIDVALRGDQVAERSTGRFAVVEVRDTGIGIPEEALAHIFDHFYQVDDSSTRAYAGTGIGLALVQELVALHGGYVSVTSEVGVGTTFTVRFPLGDEHLEASEIVQHPERMGSDGATNEAARWLGGDGVSRATPGDPSAITSSGAKEGRVLLVEDNADVRTYIASHLQTMFDVEEAAHGKQALERLEATDIDVVISDVMMPEMDGFALLRTLKGHARWQTLPVLLLTARAGEEERLRGLKARADDYLTKPFHMTELLLRVRNLVEVRRTMVANFSGQVLTVEASTIAAESEDAAFLIQLQRSAEASLADQAFDVEALAAAVHVSRTTLHRKLKRITNETPAAFLRRLRLEHAQKHLQNSTYATVQEVAYAVGFKDASYFARVFRKAYGVQPSVWLEGER